MADRYFIGGSGAKNWNDTANWSTSSGGSGGASVPTTSDNVYFDALSLSDTCTLTLDAEANCADLDMTGLDELLTITSSVYCMNIYGSITLNSNLTWTFTGTAYTYFKATSTVSLTFNSVKPRFNRQLFDSSAGVWNLQDTMETISSRCYCYAGTLNTNNNNIKTNDYLYSHADFIANFGSSTIETSGGISYTINWGSQHTDFGTSKIILTGGYSYHLYGTVYDIEFNGFVSIRGNIIDVSHDCTIKGFLGWWYSNYSQNTLNVGGTLNLQGASAYDRAWLIGVDINADNIGTCEYVQMKLCTGLGLADWDLSSCTGGASDLGDNTDIIFTTPRTLYWYKNGGNITASDKLFTATNGGGSPVSYFLCQDTIIFDENSFDTTSTLNFSFGNIYLARLNFDDIIEEVTIQITGGGSPPSVLFNGDIDFSNVILNVDGYSYLYFYNCSTFKLGVHNIDTRYYSGTGSGDIYFRDSDVGCTLLSDISGFISLQISHDFDFNDFNVSVNSVYFVGGDIYLGNGVIEVFGDYTGDTIVIRVYTEATLYAENSTIKLNAGTSTKKLTFDGNNKVFNDVWFSGTHTGYFYIEDGNTFNDLKIDAGRTIKFQAAKTQTINSLTAIGTSGSPITITSETAATHILSKSGEGRVDVEYCDISYSNVDANKFYATNCIDSGNNTNWIFVKVGKIMSKWYSNANKIAGVSRNKIEKIMEVR